MDAVEAERRILELKSVNAPGPRDADPWFIDELDNRADYSTGLKGWLCKLKTEYAAKLDASPNPGTTKEGERRRKRMHAAAVTLLRDLPVEYPLGFMLPSKPGTPAEDDFWPIGDGARLADETRDRLIELLAHVASDCGRLRITRPASERSLAARVIWPQAFRAWFALAGAEPPKSADGPFIEFVRILHLFCGAPPLDEGTGLKEAVKRYQAARARPFGW